MKITFDDQFLITVSEDACIIIWKICDKEGRGLKYDRDVPYAEEVLITKSDLEEKVGFQSKFDSARNRLPKLVIRCRLGGRTVWVGKRR